jgi:alkylation response protein AidB-like acyl-CoA dehydrogenase
MSGTTTGTLSDVHSLTQARPRSRHMPATSTHRFVADAEAIYSYEGTREMNTLIVGRAITGFSAFV